MRAVGLLAVTSLLSVGAMSAETPPSVERTKVRVAIDRAYASYIAAFARGDARAVAAVYDERGARLNENGSVVQGQEAIVADVQRFLSDVGTVKVTLETVDVWVVGNRTYETGKWQYLFTPRGRVETTSGGRYVTVWKRQSDGGWLMEADMGVPGT